MKLNEDECMMFNHPEEYGDGIEWAEEGKGYLYSFLEGTNKDSGHSMSWWNSFFLKAFKSMRFVKFSFFLKHTIMSFSGQLK